MGRWGGGRQSKAVLSRGLGPVPLGCPGHLSLLPPDKHTPCWPCLCFCGPCVRVSVCFPSPAALLGPLVGLIWGGL